MQILNFCVFYFCVHESCCIQFLKFQAAPVYSHHNFISYTLWELIIMQLVWSEAAS